MTQLYGKEGLTHELSTQGSHPFLINTPLPFPYRKKESQAQNLFSNHYYY